MLYVLFLWITTVLTSSNCLSVHFQTSSETPDGLSVDTTTWSIPVTTPSLVNADELGYKTVTTSLPFTTSVSDVPVNATETVNYDNEGSTKATPLSSAKESVKDAVSILTIAVDIINYNSKMNSTPSVTITESHKPEHYTMETKTNETFLAGTKESVNDAVSTTTSAVKIMNFSKVNSTLITEDHKSEYKTIKPETDVIPLYTKESVNDATTNEVNINFSNKMNSIPTTEGHKQEYNVIDLETDVVPLSNIKVSAKDAVSATATTNGVNIINFSNKIYSTPTTDAHKPEYNTIEPGTDVTPLSNIEESVNDELSPSTNGVISTNFSNKFYSTPTAEGHKPDYKTTRPGTYVTPLSNTEESVNDAMSPSTNGVNSINFSSKFYSTPTADGHKPEYKTIRPGTDVTTLLNNKETVKSVVAIESHDVKYNTIEPETDDPSVPKCGQRFYRIPRIIGGSDSLAGEFPWAVSVRVLTSHFCGGVIINKDWILTAGHCVRRFAARYWRVRLGGYDVNIDQFRPQWDIHVSKVVLHPRFGSPARYSYDMALLKLQRSIQSTDFAAPVCLPENLAETYDGWNVTVVGWGRTNESVDDKAPVLQKVVIPVINNSICGKWYKEVHYGYIRVRDFHICAGVREGGMDSCKGDSGGPLVVENGHGQYTLVGIVSAGVGCGRSELPGIYSRVTHFVPWILKVTGGYTLWPVEELAN